MKQMVFSRILTVVACVLMLCVSVPTLAVADQAQYIYDDLGRVSQVIDGQGNIATYDYDALDRRMAKTINGAATTYLYDGADIVTEAGATNASYLSTLNIDEPLVRQTPSGNEYYHTDDLGSTVALSDDTGSVTTRYTYGPFGSTTVTGASTNPFQFTGRENDGTGLYYYRARYYSPSRSRFLSEDPLGFDAGDPNLYAYVFNNPANLIDPSGEIPSLVKNCVTGLIRAIAQAAGSNLGGRKPDEAGNSDSPIDPLNVALACVGSNKAGKSQVNGPSGSGKAPKGSKQSKVPASGPTTTPIGGGKFTKTTTVEPGDAPGQSRAEYVVIKNQEGDTIRTYKDSYDRAGNYVNPRKPLRGGPEGRPAN